MDLLLDTQAFIWWRARDPRLGAEARRAIADATKVHVSVVSACEVAIKTRLGKLQLDASFEEGVVASQFVRLAMQFSHAAALAGLPLHHRDPFDRMLIAQATVEQLVIVTADRHFMPYNIPIIWT